jgi:glycosyltransferase involved in cell wall biosynthesis
MSDGRIGARLGCVIELALFTIIGNHLIREVLSRALYLIACLYPAKRSVFAAKSWRLTTNEVHLRRSSRLLSSTHRNDIREVDRARTSLPYTMIAAVPRDGRRGLLFCTVESDIRNLATHADRDALFRQYQIFACSPWSPPDPVPYQALVNRCSHAQLFLGISNSEDLNSFPTIADAITPVSTIASDWLDPQDFSAVDQAEKNIDVIMVAAWARYKRHWVLFDALRKLSPSLRVVLVGGGSELELHRVRTLARQLGVPQPITFHARIPLQSVHSLQARARVAVQTSWREGTCVAVAEAMMSNTPVVVTADSHLGAKLRVVEQTGFLVARRRLSDAIAEVISTTNRFAPRSYLEEKYSCHSSLSVLQRALQSRAASECPTENQWLGTPKWSGFAPKLIRPKVDSFSQYEDARSAISASFGIDLKPSSEVLQNT